METIVDRFRNSVRVRTKNQLNISVKIGDEEMDDDQLTVNANAVIAMLEKKLPQGEKNIRNVTVKLTMGKAAKLTAIKEEGR